MRKFRGLAILAACQLLMKICIERQILVEGIYNQKGLIPEGPDSDHREADARRQGGKQKSGQEEKPSPPFFLQAFGICRRVLLLKYHVFADEKIQNQNHYLDQYFGNHIIHAPDDA